MNRTEFLVWLRGYLDASRPLDGELRTISDQLDEVLENTSTPPNPINPFTPLDVRPAETNDDGKVPFHEVCSCNPKNGGSGVCGCVMPNQMVYPTTKRNWGTLTTNTEDRIINKDDII